MTCVILNEMRNGGGEWGRCTRGRRRDYRLVNAKVLQIVAAFLFIKNFPEPSHLTDYFPPSTFRVSPSGLSELDIFEWSKLKLNTVEF